LAQPFSGKRRQHYEKEGAEPVNTVWAKVNQGLWLMGLGLMLGSCQVSSPPPQARGFEVKLLFGSALDDFCAEAAARFNQTQPQLSNGDPFFITCEAAGSGDVVTSVLSLAEQMKSGQIQAVDSQFPTLLSVDGEIYQSQLIYQMDQLFPGQNYIPAITDSPLLAHSPMVLMTTAELAPGLRQVDDIYAELVTASTHEDLDANSPPFDIHFVHTAPTRSNSGLQTLVAQFASVSGKRPEDLTLEDVETYQDEVAQIQQKVTRYGVSTSSLAQAMATNGPFWASIGSVYESLVIRVNSEGGANTQPYEAVYPQATFSSNMRAILPQAPWVSAEEKEAAELMIRFFQTEPIQMLAQEEGLRPGVPGIPLSNKFSAAFGVEPQPQYDSYRSPRPEVAEAMLQAWQEVVKKPSRVVVVVDSSGSMEGRKIAAVQQTLQTYVDRLGPKEEIALIDFDTEIRAPVMVSGARQDRQEAIRFISNLEAEGGTRLYDAVLYAQEWLQQNRRENAINAVLVLTDGEDSESQINLETLSQALEATGFNTDQRIAFFTLGYGREGQFNPRVLERIAAENGGYYRKGDPETIASVMSDLQLEF
jgi:Ca-activated chloride channel family protein